MRLRSNLGEFLLLLSSKFLLMLVLQDSAHLSPISQLPCSLCELALDPLAVLCFGCPLFMSSLIPFGDSQFTEPCKMLLWFGIRWFSTQQD